MVTIGDLDKRVPADVVNDMELNLNKFWWLLFLCFLILTVCAQATDLPNFIREERYITIGYQWSISFGVTFLLCIKRKMETRLWWWLLILELASGRLIASYFDKTMKVIVNPSEYGK